MKHSCTGTDNITIRFAGDSGDGIQLAGDQLALAATIDGNEIMTWSDFPAEIRPPEGSLAGVSSFQLRIGNNRVFTPGDMADIMVAFNPAALKVSLPYLKKGGALILNEDTFIPAGLEKANYKTNPLIDNSLQSSYQVIRVPLTKLTRNVFQNIGKNTELNRKEIDRCKNFFALGLVSWITQKPTRLFEGLIKTKFSTKPKLIEANLTCLDAGYRYGENGEIFGTCYFVNQTHNQTQLIETKTRYVSGNTAMALGLYEFAKRSQLKLFMAGYPITPATSLYQDVAAIDDDCVETFQAEDEIAAIGAALGASYAGSFGVTCTSGPGLSLMLEIMNLGVMAELPMVIINVQRAGPSTGLPTKSEQADLLQACYGRHGESPVIVMSANSPADGYSTVIEASNLAIQYMTPVIVLSDGYLSNSAENLDETQNIAPIQPVNFYQELQNFKAYARNERTLARPWVLLGTPGFESTTGGLEKDNPTGAFSQDAENHETMVHLRNQKILRAAQDFSPSIFCGADHGDLLIIGWGSTFGAIREATLQAQKEGLSVSHLHLRHLHPFPLDLEKYLQKNNSGEYKFKKIVVVENNLGQLWMKLRAEYLVPATKLNQIQGRPFKISEIFDYIIKQLRRSS